MWREPERFDPARGSLRTYLLTMADGRAVDLLRSERSRHSIQRGRCQPQEFAAGVVSDLGFSDQPAQTTWAVMGNSEDPQWATAPLA